jgi:hypothetical protein
MGEVEHPMTLPPVQGAKTTMPVPFRLIAAAGAVVLAVMLGADAALAGLGQPSPWQMTLQQSASPVMDDIIWFHDFLLWIIAAIPPTTRCSRWRGR